MKKQKKIPGSDNTRPTLTKTKLTTKRVFLSQFKIKSTQQNKITQIKTIELKCTNFLISIIICVVSHELTSLFN